MSTISLCMIVYNEENNIQRCLESAREYVDEIIIVDTGSTDQTKSICKKYGAQVFNYKWEDDFSEARNYSILKASCDWILLLDADEELKIRSSVDLKKYLLNTTCDLIPIRMTHFYGNQPANEKRAHIADGLRLIRNDSTVRFIGKIHERVDVGNKNIDQVTETYHFIRILHYGYMEAAFENKTNRNISLLLKEKDKQLDDPWLNYFLAAEYYRSGKFKKAYQDVNMAITIFLKKELKPPSLLYKLKYDLLITLGYYDIAYRAIEKAVMLYPDYVDLHFYKGILQYEREEYDKARNTFLTCLILGETSRKYLILSGSGSFLAFYYIGLCHKKQGEIEQATEAFRQAEELCPEFRFGKQLYKYTDILNRKS